MGLSDIRLVVKLMCLCAAGRVDSYVAQDLRNTVLGEQVTVGISQSIDDLMGTATVASLTYLSTAIGALVQDNPNASRLLIRLCTQVRYLNTLQYGYGNSV